MTNKEIYKIWAPCGKEWISWVRPVPFIYINKNTPPPQLTLMGLPFLSNLHLDDKKTAIIVDLTGDDSVEAGILLAKQYGYRPIPVYNGVQEQPGARAASDNSSILGGLVWGASILSTMNISDDAPPAFLIDSNRLNRYRSDCSIFDNSWDVYHQDLPTEEYLLNHGIERIVVIGQFLAKDLKRIFADYPKKQIAIYWTDGYSKMKCLKKDHQKNIKQ
jgi:hypothetical protein